VKRYIFLLLTVALFAKENKWNSALMFGTLGVGVDVSYKYRKDLAFRASFNGLNYTDRNRKYKSLNFNSTFTFFNAGLLLDNYFFDSNFRFTFGGFYNDSIYQTRATAIKYQEMKLLGQKLSTKDFKNINASVTFNKFNPYIGLGWGNKPTKGYGFSLDLGLMYSKPKVKFKPVYSDDIINTKKEETYNRDFELMDKTAEKLISKHFIYNFQPVIRFGINYSY